MKTQLTVLSVRQPWASLLLTGEDWCENRTWVTDFRGPLWIHASATVDKDECELHGLDPNQFTIAAILGCVELKEIISIDFSDPGFDVLEFETIDKYGLHKYGTDFLAGPYGWIVTNPQPLAEPIPAKGKLKLWTYAVDENWSPVFRRPVPMFDWPPNPQYETYRETITVRGKIETVVFRKEDRSIAMYYLTRRRKHIAMPEDSVQYRSKGPHYKAGCEKAWELFPKKFKQNKS